MPARHRRAAFPLALALAGLLLPAQAAATEAAAAASVQTVEVSAQRQLQDLRVVPIAMSVWEPRAVQALGIDGVSALTALAPSTFVGTAPGSALIPALGVRGLASGQPGLWADLPVAVYVDGVYLGKSVGAMLDVADVLRVEALRGPQGTLYGRNAAVGSLHFETRAPSGLPGGSLRLAAGDRAARDARASLDLPALGPVAASVWLRRQSLDGAIERASANAGAGAGTSPGTGRWGDRRREAARLALHGEAAAGRLAWRFTADASRADESPIAGWLLADRGYAADYPADTPVGRIARAFAAGPGATLAPFVQTGWPAHVASGDELGAPAQHADVSGQSLRVDWQPGGGIALRWIAARRSVGEGVTQDLDGSPRFVLSLVRDSRYRLQSHELTATAAGAGWRQVVGLHVFEDQGRTTLRQAGELLSFRVGEPGWQRQAFDVDASARALYGQFELERGRWTLSLGGRQTRETRGIALLRERTTAGFGSALPGSVVERSAQARFDAFTPLLQGGVELGGGVRGWARWGRGFRSGAFPAEAPLTAGGSPDVAYRPERTQSVELGLKGRLGDAATPGAWPGRWSLGAYRMDVRDLQASVLPPGSISPTIVNAGRLASHGLEAELTLRLPGDGRLRASYGWLRARLQTLDATAADGRPLDAATDLRPAAAPRHTLALLVETPRRPLGRLGDAALTLDLRHQGSRLSVLARRDAVDPATTAVAPRESDARLPALTLVNLQASLALAAAPPGGGRAELTLAVTNALDRREPTALIDVGGLYRLAYGSEPRRIRLVWTQGW